MGHYHGHLRVDILFLESLFPVLGRQEEREAEGLVVQPKSGSRLNIRHMKKFLVYLHISSITSTLN